MANIVNFTDKQFENRLNDNLEELVQVKKRLNRQPLFYLVGNQGQGNQGGKALKWLPAHFNLERRNAPKSERER